MKSRFLRENCKIPMSLQMYAGDGDGTEGDGNDDGSGKDGSDGNKKMSFDDFLKDGNQAEFDRRVQQAINTAVNNAREKWKLMTDDKVSEAEKLAKMNKEEKAEYLRQKKEKELSDRETNITKRELMAEAKNTLAEKKLPVGLAEILNYSDADSCNKSIASVEKAFNESVEAAVQERLKGKDTQIKAPDGNEDETAKKVEAIMRGEI